MPNRPLLSLQFPVKAGLAAACASVAALSAPVVVDAPMAVAEQPARLTDAVTDRSHILSDAERAELSKHIDQIKNDTQTTASVVFIRTFDGIEPQQWAKQTWQLQGSAKNRVVIAISVDDRNLGIHAGNNVDVSADDLGKAAYPFLSEDKWANGAIAAVDRIGGPETNWGLIGAGAGAAAVLGGGGLAIGKRAKRKQSEAELARGRATNPADVQSLDSLTTPSLRQLAKEEIVSTDESIRKASEELELARAEFGDGRVRTLETALAASQRSLANAHATMQQLDDARLPEDAERTSLIGVISSCGQADDRLDSEAHTFSEMREDLLNADMLIEHLTQRSVAVRTRITEARSQLGSLQQRFDAKMLASISDNPAIAEELLAQADQSLDTARNLITKPAGQQAGLVEGLHQTNSLLDKSEKLCAAIEHADSDIAQAQTGLAALQAEVREEVLEARKLAQAPDAAVVNRDKLHDAIAAGDKALSCPESDPLAAWTMLTDADAKLDEHIADARGAAQSYERIMQTLSNALRDAESQVHSAEGLISTRGRVIGASARTRLSEAIRHYDAAHSIAAAPGVEPTNNPRRGIAEAQSASRLAREAIQEAQRDINRYNNRNSGGGSGSMLTGMIIGSMLSGGGFGGGGGGNFGGGGFGGGSSSNGTSMGF